MGWGHFVSIISSWTTVLQHTDRVESGEGTFILEHGR